MRIDTFTRAATAALTLLILVSPAAASESPAAHSTSVRADTTGMKQLIGEGAAGSATFRSLIDVINQSNLIVYVRCRVFTRLELQGQLTFLSATGGFRYAVVEIACLSQTGLGQMGTLAHELQHAVEVASAPWVTDTKTLDRFYAEHGQLVRGDAWARAYETTAAVERARQVQRELREGDKLLAAESLVLR